MGKPTTTTRPRNDQQQAGPAPQNNLPANNTGGKGPHPLVVFKEYVDQRMSSLIDALPPHITPNAFVSVVITALQRKPELLRCTKQSLWNSCLLAAQDGLLPDGREGAIAPYGQNEKGTRVAEIATWMPMVGGYRKKAMNSGLIAKWEVNLVRARDKFKVTLGDDAQIAHEPYFGPEDPGDVVGAYSIATLSDGSVMRDIMTIRDILKIKAKSKAQNGPWADTTFFPEMCRKTMARRHYKQLPCSAEMDKMIDRDDQEFGLEDNAQQIAADRQARRLTSTSAAFDQFASPGPVIDHQHDPVNEPDSHQIDGDDEFADSAPPVDPKPARQRAPAKEKETERQPQRQQEQQPDREEQQTEDQEHRDPTEQKQKDSTAGDAADDDTADNDASDRRWPPGETPSTADEYASYVKMKLEDWTAKTEFDTGTMQVVGADGISSWWKGKGERGLRNACSVTEEMFHKLMADCRNRAEAIRKGK